MICWLVVFVSDRCICIPPYTQAKTNLLQISQNQARFECFFVCNYQLIWILLNHRLTSSLQKKASIPGDSARSATFLCRWLFAPKDEYPCSHRLRGHYVGLARELRCLRWGLFPAMCLQYIFFLGRSWRKTFCNLFDGILARGACSSFGELDTSWMRVDVKVCFWDCWNFQLSVVFSKQACGWSKGPALVVCGKSSFLYENRRHPSFSARERFYNVNNVRLGFSIDSL